jgi:hypothetical protein
MGNTIWNGLTVLSFEPNRNGKYPPRRRRLFWHPAILPLPCLGEARDSRTPRSFRECSSNSEQFAGRRNCQ